MASTDKHRRPLIVGITGGIGSGKTFVCRRLEAMGYPVFYCDDEARRLMVGEPSLRAALTSLIGEPVVSADGSLRKDAVTRYMHAAPGNDKRIDELVHRFVAAELARWIARRRKRMAFVECALLFESGFDRHVDKSVEVYARRDTRMHLVMERSHLPAATIAHWMSLQMDDDEKCKRADLILLNDGDTPPDLSPILALQP